LIAKSRIDRTWALLSINKRARLFSTGYLKIELFSFLFSNNSELALSCGVEFSFFIPLDPVASALEADNPKKKTEMKVPKI